MGMCWAPNCKHYSPREKCRFFRFPKYEKERNQWINVFRRGQPGPGAFICSCHFRDGKKENGPELLLPKTTKIFTNTARGFRKLTMLSKEKMNGTALDSAVVVVDDDDDDDDDDESDLETKKSELLKERDEAWSKLENRTEISIIPKEVVPKSAVGTAIVVSKTISKEPPVVAERYDSRYFRNTPTTF